MSTIMRRAFCAATLLASSIWAQDNSVSQTNAIQAPKIIGPWERVTSNINNVTNPEHIFMSRPDLMAPILNVTMNNGSYVTPGYIFVCPYWTDQTGPYIYATNGDLIWSGFGNGGAGTSTTMTVVNINGSPHLAVNNINLANGYGHGHGLIFDQSYRTYKTVEVGNGRTSSDLHEFNVLPDGKSAILTIYDQVQYDLSSYGVQGGFGWVVQPMFQEIDITTGAVLFEWNGLDHVSPNDSYSQLSSTDVSGNGLTYTTAWDYLQVYQQAYFTFHINAIDKCSNGDYLVSSRATGTIFRVSGKDGSIKWRLGGKHTDFALTNFNFAFQHHVRFQSETNTTTTLTIFDNGSDGFNVTQPQSAGMVIQVDTSTKKATLLKQYVGPQGPLTAASQGSMQVLPNGNAFMGWGIIPAMSEYTPDGNPVWYANLGSHGISNYRAFKFDWTSTPIDKPAVWSYAKTNSSATYVYVSWNGATQVTQWRVWTSSSQNSTYTAQPTAAKQGFETMIKASKFAAYVYVEALSFGGQSLSKSLPVKTFVPGPVLVQSCGDTSCNTATGHKTPR